MPHTDAAAVALAREGDSEAFRALVERHSRAVFRLAQRMTGSPQDAEDVVQETFLRAYRQLGRFESRANFGTWVHRIAVNCSIDLIRSRANRETGHEPEDLEQFGATVERTDAMSASPERLMQSSEVQERVQAAMASLSRMERAAFALRHFEGQSIEEISRALGLKTNAAKQFRERILLVDLGDHLDRSQMVLVEIASASGDSVDLTFERARAEQLVQDNRVYRQTAITSGDPRIADLLDDLERVLVEVAAAPAEVPASDLSGVQRRIDSRDLVFKLRVLSAELRERQKPGRKTTNM